ncbi:serine/threonine-protein kinase GRIK1-like [Panicum miliaceum]|uniref:Serine/threonine-protein kinase GRIK1-like n=1 Tax=Panicum miliaceum TaxID=4540 RepID=A0A3L6TFG9_PANMI|nr:serine/threonine-protein kinase GRIK1-like [Panicum miliaceum]
MVGLVNAAMEEAYKKSLLKDSDLDRLFHKLRFAELTIMQLQWCLRFIRGEMEVDDGQEQLLDDLLEMRDQIQARLDEAELAVAEGDVRALRRPGSDGVSIMKMLNHPNIVNLVEVINDPNIDKFYMVAIYIFPCGLPVLEYVEGKMVCDNGLEEATARNYLRDIIYGLMYLHSHNVIHGDIKPDNLLVTSSGNVKIGDFSVSQVFEDDDDMLWRSPGTPVFTAPECCQGSAYHGRASDTWAVGVTLYCMISGHYPFLGDTLQETYDKIANDPVQIPGDVNPQLADLIQRLLCKDPGDRITLQAAAEHPWVVGDKGPMPEYICSYRIDIVTSKIVVCH